MVMSSSPQGQRTSVSPPQTRRQDEEDEEDEEEMMTPTEARHRRSVFDDPASPISSIASTEFHTLPGAAGGVWLVIWVGDDDAEGMRDAK